MRQRWPGSASPRERGVIDRDHQHSARSVDPAGANAGPGLRRLALLQLVEPAHDGIHFRLEPLVAIFALGRPLEDEEGGQDHKRRQLQELDMMFSNERANQVQT